MKNIDITMSATIRPSILDQTLRSFSQNMLSRKNHYRLILNVDPIGEDVRQDSMLIVARNYFDDIVYNFPKTPCFCKAVIWCWDQVTADYCLHLEDDWRLLFPIDVDDMINIMERHKDLVSLRLSKDLVPRCKAGIKYGFIYAPKISLNPTLFLSSFIKNVVTLMDPTLNPEKQLRPSEKTPRGVLISKINNGIYTRNHFGPVVVDIGRTWMENSKYTKDTGFIEWRSK